MRMLARVCLRIALLVIGVAGCLWGYAEARQILSRMRAERLLADVQALQVQKSTWSDAQRFMTRWGRWGHFDGRCDESSGRYLVRIANRFPEAWYPEVESPRHPRLLRMLSAVGLRPSTAIAGFELRDGVVVNRSFGISTSFRRDGELYIDSGEGPRVIEYSDRRLHPDYSVGAHPSFVFLASFTPEATPAKREQMFHFRFHCLTAIRECEGVEQVLPEVYEESMADRAVLEREGWPSCGLPFWVTARDEQTVVVGDVVQAARIAPLPDVPAEGPGPLDWNVELRVRQILKGKLTDLPGGILPLEVDGSVRSGPDGKFPYKVLLIAGRPIFGDDVKVMGPLESTGCNVVEATAENMAAAERGVRADFAPYVGRP